jgi:hypothetical protein
MVAELENEVNDSPVRQKVFAGPTVQIETTTS